MDRPRRIWFASTGRVLSKRVLSVAKSVQVCLKYLNMNMSFIAACSELSLISACEKGSSWKHAVATLWTMPSYAQTPDDASQAPRPTPDQSRSAFGLKKPRLQCRNYGVPTATGMAACALDIQPHGQELGTQIQVECCQLTDECQLSGLEAKVCATRSRTTR